MPELELTEATISYEIRRSPRARRLRITVEPGGVVAVAPRFTPTRRIRAFVESKKAWIQSKRAALAQRDLLSAPERFESGARIRVRNRVWTLQVKEVAGGPRVRSVEFDDRCLATVEAGLSDDERETVLRRLVMGWLKDRARQHAETWVRQYEPKLGVAPSRIRIGNQKTLWGSCSARGTVSLNWRLMAAPEEVFEYVVVHELCHLREPNHGPRFWALVGELMPDYPERRTWLETRGVGLG